MAGARLVAEAEVHQSFGLPQPREIGDRNSCDSIDRIDAVELQGVHHEVEAVSQGRAFGFCRHGECLSMFAWGDAEARYFAGTAARALACVACFACGAAASTALAAWSLAICSGPYPKLANTSSVCWLSCCEPVSLSLKSETFITLPMVK